MNEAELYADYVWPSWFAVLTVFPSTGAEILAGVRNFGAELEVVAVVQ